MTLYSDEATRGPKPGTCMFMISPYVLGEPYKYSIRKVYIVGCCGEITPDKFVSHTVTYRVIDSTRRVLPEPLAVIDEWFLPTLQGAKERLINRAETACTDLVASINSNKDPGEPLL